MRRDIHEIEIKEPPMREFDKKSSCLKRSCFTGCGCILAVLILGMVFFQFVLRPGTKELKDLPENFPNDIALYDQENIHSISYTGSEEKNKWIQRLAKVTHALLKPIIGSLRSQTTGTENIFDSLLRALEEPSLQKQESVKIEWIGLSAQPKFIDEYYHNELKKKYFTIHESTATETIRQFAFTTGTISGVVYLQDDPKVAGTDYASLSVLYERNN